MTRNARDVALSGSNLREFWWGRKEQYVRHLKTKRGTNVHEQHQSSGQLQLFPKQEPKFDTESEEPSSEIVFQKHPIQETKVPRWRNSSQFKIHHLEYEEKQKHRWLTYWENRHNKQGNSIQAKHKGGQTYPSDDAEWKPKRKEQQDLYYSGGRFWSPSKRFHRQHRRPTSRFLN